MHALKRLGKLKRLVDWRAGRFVMRFAGLDNVFSMSHVWGMFPLLHLLIGAGW